MATIDMAMKVLRKIGNLPKKNEKYWIEAYSNGREQGFLICYWKINSRNAIRVAFSENRNSDSLVVYVGDGKETGQFDMTGNVPSDTVWNNARYFSQDKYLIDGVKFIKKQLGLK